MRTEGGIMTSRVSAGGRVAPGDELKTPAEPRMICLNCGRNIRYWGNSNRPEAWRHTLNGGTFCQDSVGRFPGTMAEPAADISPSSRGLTNPK